MVDSIKFDYRNYQLSIEERQSIVNKEAFSIDDLGKLYAMRYDEAQKLSKDIRRKYDRLHRGSNVHVLDYCLYFETTVYELRGVSLPV